MKLLRLDVEDFGRVQSAAVEFGPGLNVLYGPNDLGKSTLAHAIRVALLLPHTSKAIESFEPWERDARPSVTLTFRGDDERVWRVRKTFARSGGTSDLEVAVDGKTFTHEAKSRAVDGRLREMLGWGVAQPGGKGGRRGLPESFLSRVLLGEQGDAERALQSTLDDDEDASGRDRLTEALEALAMDERFRAVLEAAERKVAEAFTATGKVRSAQSSPFRQVADEVKKARAERDDRQEALQRAQDAIEERTRLHEALLRAEAERERWRTRARAAEARAERVQALQRADAALEAARKRHDDALGQRAEAERAALEAEAAKKARDEAIVARDAQRAKVEAARAALDAAREAVRVAGADDAAQEARLRRAEVERELADARERLERSRDAARAAHARAERTRARAASAQRLAEEQERAAAARARVEELTRRRDELARVRALAQLRLCERRHAEVAERAARAEELRATAAELEQRALEKEAALESLPDEATLRELRALERELHVAEAALAVGLSVAIRRPGGVTIDAAQDGGARAELPPGEVVDLEVARELELVATLATGEPLLELRVQGGASDARAARDELRKRWTEASAALGGGSLDDVEAALAALRRELQDMRDEAGRARQRATDRQPAPGALAAAEDALREARAAAPESEAESAAEELGELERQRREAEAQEQDVLRELASAEARLGSAELRVREAERALESSDAGRPDEELEDPERADAAVSAREGEVAELRERLGELPKVEARVQDAEAAVDAARAELADVEAALRAGEDDAGRRSEEAAAADARARSWRERLEGADLEALANEVERLRAARDTARAELDAHDEAADEDEVSAAEAERALARAEADLREARAAMQKHEGRLEEAGGAVAIEKAEQAEEAYERALARQHDVTVEFGAWKLLADTLKEAEQEVGQHLGRALAQPISKELRRLLDRVGAAGRYQGVAMDTGLAGLGVEVGGHVRPMQSLSVGTREQIAALLRLSVASHLRAPLLLDDHFTHTDPARTRFFRDALRAEAHTTQVLVLTCHPLDYLDDADLPEEGRASRDRAAGLVRAVDLSRVIDAG